MRAPANIKIDGKPIEWGQYQAYNRATNVFYSIANNDANLYLVVCATEPVIIEKMVVGGVTLTVNISGKKSDKGAASITFPVFDKNNPHFYLNFNRNELLKDTVKNRNKIDSLSKLYNKKIINSLVKIGVEGIKPITDSIISIYNEEGIVAASHFDSKANYTYELAVPLKYFGLTTANLAKFSYNVKLNGSTAGGSNVQIIKTRAGERIIYTAGDGTNWMVGMATPSNMILAYPNDFWGEYTLAKK